MTAQPKRSDAALFQMLRDAQAVILEDGRPPWRAVQRGDTRCRPTAWVEASTLASWRAQGLVARHPKGWMLLSRPAPRPIVCETEDGVETVQVRENWMQRLARDLELDGPLAEAGHRLVADGLRLEVGSVRSSTHPVIADGRPRNSAAEEDRILARLDARRRVRAALAGLGEREKALAAAICLRDQSLVEAAGSEGMSETEAIRDFTLALLKLSRFYGTMPGWSRHRR